MQGLGFWIEGLGIRDVAVYRDLRIEGGGLEGLWISGLRVKGFRGQDPGIWDYGGGIWGLRMRLDPRP